MRHTATDRGAGSRDRGPAAVRADQQSGPYRRVAQGDGTVPPAAEGGGATDAGPARRACSCSSRSRMVRRGAIGGWIPGGHTVRARCRPSMTTSAADIGGQPVPSRSGRMPQAASLATPSGLIMCPLIVSAPAAARSMTRTRRPEPARSIAVAAPAQRPPITTTSKLSMPGGCGSRAPRRVPEFGYFRPAVVTTRASVRYTARQAGGQASLCLPRRGGPRWRIRRVRLGSSRHCLVRVSRRGGRRAD